MGEHVNPSPFVIGPALSVGLATESSSVRSLRWDFFFLATAVKQIGAGVRSAGVREGKYKLPEREKV